MNNIDIFHSLVNRLTDDLRKEYDAFVKHELEKLGFSLSKLINEKYKTERYIQFIDDGVELHRYFIDDCLVLQFKKIVKMKEDNNNAYIEMRFEPILEYCKS